MIVIFIAIFFITGNNINKTHQETYQGHELLFDYVYQSIYNDSFGLIYV